MSDQDTERRNITTAPIGPGREAPLVSQREMIYRELFESSPIGIWEEDWSRIKDMVDTLRARGITDWHDYFSCHEDQLAHAYDLASVKHVNRAALDIYRTQNLQELIELTASNVLPPEELPGFRYNLVAFIEGQTSYQMESKELTFDGFEISTRRNVTIPPDHRTTWSRVLYTIEDITERRNAEIALAEAIQAANAASAAKTEFLTSMSHELRTPLNAIIGFSDIMMGRTLGPIGDLKYLEYASDINNSGHHLLDLINGILDLSKIEAGKFELREANIDVLQLLKFCISMVGEQAKNNEVDIAPDIAPDLPPLFADELKCRQILVNILSNAVKFTPSGGKVKINIWFRREKACIFQITDTGIGIAAADIQKALTPFQQIDGELNRKYAGTGLGLPLAKSLVELHGGSLELHSEIGVGTTVTIRFPAHRIAPQSACELDSENGVRG